MMSGICLVSIAALEPGWLIGWLVGWLVSCWVGGLVGIIDFQGSWLMTGKSLESIAAL